MKRKHTAALTAVLLAAALLAGCGQPAGREAAGRPGSEDTSVAERIPGEAKSTRTGGSAPLVTDGNRQYSAEAFYGDAFYYTEEEYNTEEYAAREENGYRITTVSPLSTFAADIDTASYANVRRMLENGFRIQDIPSGAVRAEEFINYFTYGYRGPEAGEPFGVNVQISVCPWNPEHYLAVLGLQTETVDFTEAPASNLVFLVDVSGSMDAENKLPLLKEAFAMLTEGLGEKDRVSIVTYAAGSEVILEGVTGDRQEEILSAMAALEAEGSTNGGDALRTAYRIAERYFIPGGNNRIIMATDGDLNVGITSQSELDDLVSEEKETGVYLSVLGFGTGNYSDARLETLADRGNGNYSYIDSREEARKVLVEELGATLVTVAEDVKLQLEFNPAKVASYRQVGYENRQMAAEDFRDDKKDGGEIGAGHSVTVMYELVPAEGAVYDPGLRYQDNTLTRTAEESAEWFSLSVRYRQPEGETEELTYYFGDEAFTESPDEDFRFAACAAEFAQVLSGSEYLGEGSIDHILSSLAEMTLIDDYRREFASLVLKAA